jgi:quercetin 2,3-dioxygenase
MSKHVVINVIPLGFPWATVDPFLFCAHHDDAYPAGNEQMGPAASLAGRNLGMDFEVKDGWRMYHGDVVPGFPRHPHRGFETVTLARHGYIDHSDSLGATARFGHGDVQWMTAGRGVVHSEMFPLVNRDGGNRTELFQIWLNLPRADKLVDPHFGMLWSESIPRHTFTDEGGRTTTVTTIAGALEGRTPPAPPPSSWAAKPDSDVAIWTVRMDPGARYTLPPARAGSTRVLYFFRGAGLSVAGHQVNPYSGVQVRPEASVELENGPDEGELLVLQGRPLEEPVVQHGPFVMNTPAEIQQAFVDFRKTGFGGWPWDSDGPVHDRSEGRFAIHADGRKDRPA